MSKNLQVENAGMAREVDMFDKKKGVLDMVGKIKPKGSSEPQVTKADKKLDKLEKKSDNQEKPINDEEHVQKKKKKSKKDKEHDILSESDISEAVKEIPVHDDASDFRFDEFEEPLSDRKEIKEKSEETKKLLVSVQSVENRLKSREQVNLTMMSIEIANLPSAHRFTKNMPWLKGSYGLNYSWVAEYEESVDGTRASWKNMRWSFNLERNESDRNDLVITVCSKNLILGRYVLGKHEFLDIPDTKTGYFEVSGDIMSGIGIAGKIRILFLKSKAERPKGPSKPVILSQITPGTAALSPLKQSLLQQKQLYVKILSAAVMDLKSVHFLDVNSPFIAVEVGDWVGVSDTAFNAGMAARWNNLNWKFTVTIETGVHLVIHSKNTLIGRMHVSLEEIANAEAKKNNVLEVIKHITDGKDVTGKVKLNLLAETPKLGEQYIGTTGTAGSSAGGLGEGAVKTLDAEGNVVETEESAEADAEGQQQHAPPTTLSSHSAGHLLGTGNTTTTTAGGGGISDLAPIKPFMRVPFQINVHEVTLLDTIKAQYFRTNALSVNVVCGPWGKATDELPSSGSYAHWINLKWRIPVKGNNNLRITAWSHGKSIGAANITVSDLLEMPTDYEQNTEIFAKLLNTKQEIVGKVKLSCKYESLISVINDRIVAITTTTNTSTTREQVTTSPGIKTSNFIPNIGTEKPKNVSFFHENNDEEDDFLFADGDQQQQLSSPHKHMTHIIEPLSLPIVANIKTISVYDAISVHTFKKNAPYIKFICDRKSATTTVIKSAGPVATWPGLNWLMKIRADSHVVAVLYSGDVEIGKVLLKPEELLSIPVNDDGLTEVSGYTQLWVMKMLILPFFFLHSLIFPNVLLWYCRLKHCLRRMGAPLPSCTCWQTSRASKTWCHLIMPTVAPQRGLFRVVVELVAVRYVLSCFVCCVLFCFLTCVVVLLVYCCSAEAISVGRCMETQLVAWTGSPPPPSRRHCPLCRPSAWDRLRPTPVEGVCMGDRSPSASPPYLHTAMPPDRRCPSHSATLASPTVVPSGPRFRTMGDSGVVVWGHQAVR